MHTPDKWLIIKVNGKEPHYRVFGSWYGGYTQGDSWRMNSGITGVTEEDDCYLFSGSSGSTYKCYKNSYGISGYGSSVLDNLISNSTEATIEIVPEDTNIMELNFK